MKRESENEMDLLLRNLGRLKDTSRPEGEEADATHLDPDELNAYAEKALPAAAHARYTEHLADCSRCRTLVSQLSLAAGVVIEEKVPGVVPKTSGIKAFLSSLFSPMAMRYAVPVMGLIIVASIGFLVFRQSKSERFAVSESSESVAERREEQPGSAGLANTAQNEQQAIRTPSQQVAQNKSGEATRGAATKEQPAAPAADSRSASKDAKSDQPVTATDSIADTPARVAGRVDVAAASPKPAPPTVQNEPIRKTVQAPAESVEVAKTNEKEAKAPAKVAEPMTGGFAVGRGAAKAKNETASRAQAEAGRDEEAKKRGREDKDEAAKQRERQDKDEPDLKTVAGRRFRKEGSVWIDVAYSSQATTNVARGSEQYRALVADEPGIKTIADQLGGEVIVVWKGRAYKIR
jgi:hypothetical protein